MLCECVFGCVDVVVDDGVECECECVVVCDVLKCYVLLCCFGCIL